jgi:hypothetical protein
MAKKITAGDMGLTPSQVKKIIAQLEASIPAAKKKAAKAAIKAGAKSVTDKTTGKTYTAKSGRSSRGRGGSLGGGGFLENIK